MPGLQLKGVSSGVIFMSVGAVQHPKQSIYRNPISKPLPPPPLDKKMYFCFCASHNHKKVQHTLLSADSTNRWVLKRSPCLPSTSLTSDSEEFSLALRTMPNTLHQNPTMIRSKQIWSNYYHNINKNDNDHYCKTSQDAQFFYENLFNIMIVSFSWKSLSYNNR